MSKQLTIRGVSEDLASRLESLAEDRGQSVNATVLEILEGAMGVEGRLERLRRYATWTETDLEEVERAVAAQRTVDDELWK
jgi:plasmid stability protein